MDNLPLEVISHVISFLSLEEKFKLVCLNNKRINRILLRDYQLSLSSLFHDKLIPMFPTGLWYLPRNQKLLHIELHNSSICVSEYFRPIHPSYFTNCRLYHEEFLNYWNLHILPFLISCDGFFVGVNDDSFITFKIINNTFILNGKDPVPLSHKSCISKVYVNSSMIISDYVSKIHINEFGKLSSFTVLNYSRINYAKITVKKTNINIVIIKYIDQASVFDL